MKLAWVHYRIPPEESIARGYMNTAFSLWQALKAAKGLDLVDAPRTGAHPHAHLHVCPPHFFQPVPGKYNVLFSMWEGDTLPAPFVEQLGRAQHLIVPSEYCKAVWKAHGFEADVVPLGLHPAWLEVSTDRRVLATPDRVLRFLWVGARNERKGWRYLAPAWQAAFGERPPRDAQLYVKTIGEEGDKQLTEFFDGAVVIDKRDLDPVGMLRLYESADVFVFPTLGEGFGLPVLEAMAAGCLVLAPLVGGLLDFYNPYRGIAILRSQEAVAQYGGPPYATMVPTVEDVAHAIVLARSKWGQPEVEERRRAGIEAARRFTWDGSCSALLAVLEALKSEKIAYLPPPPARPAPGAVVEARLNAPGSSVVRFPERP